MVVTNRPFANSRQSAENNPYFGYMFKAIIIDDEPKIQRVLEIKLQEFCKDLNIVDKAEDIESAYRSITKHKPDLIFLDINMPGASGFKLLEMFETIEFEIIFVTGYNEYALDALKVSAVDYLLKPIKTEDLVIAVDKAKERVERKAMVDSYKVLKHNVNNLGSQETQIAITSAEAYDIVKISDIIRCEGWNKYTKIHLTSGDTLLSSANIGTFREQLEPYDFYACHKSHIINKKKIKRYLKEGTIVLDDGSEVPVARRRKEFFVDNVLKSIYTN